MAEVSLTKLPSDKCHYTLLMISQHWFSLTAPSHYLSQCWSRSLSPNGVTRPQWVNNVRHGWCCYIYILMKFLWDVEVTSACWGQPSVLPVMINPLTHWPRGKFEWKFRYVIFKGILLIDGWGISWEIAIIWMSLDLMMISRHWFR